MKGFLRVLKKIFIGIGVLVALVIGIPIVMVVSDSLDKSQPKTIRPIQSNGLEILQACRSRVQSNGAMQEVTLVSWDRHFTEHDRGNYNTPEKYVTSGHVFIRTRSGQEQRWRYRCTLYGDDPTKNRTAYLLWTEE